VLDEIGRLAGHAVEAAPDPALVRTADPAVVIGDASELRRHTGWAPRIPLTQTLRDLLDGVDGVDGVDTAPGQGVSATRRG
jgi:GDP-4-dehydro-6-deoxy-D-mannose reductase